MNDFVFRFIFENEKDKGWSNSRWFRTYIKKKYRITNQEDGTKLYVAINKYQIEKYGITIDPTVLYYKEDYIKRATAIRNQRKREKSRVLVDL